MENVLTRSTFSLKYCLSCAVLLLPQTSQYAGTEKTAIAKVDTTVSIVMKLLSMKICMAARCAS